MFSRRTGKVSCYSDLIITQHRQYITHAAFNCAPTAPVSMSYINAPRLHQSTARLWPLLIKISGALQQEKQYTPKIHPLAYHLNKSF